VHPSLDVEPVVHELAEERLPTEDVLQLTGDAASAVVVPHPQPGLDLPRRAAGGGDETGRVVLEELAVDARLVEVALEARQRRHPEQVVHALGRLREHGHVCVGAATGDVILAALGPPDSGPVRPVGARRHVELGADDRTHTGVLGLLDEVVGTEHVAVVGHRDRRHPHPGGLFEQVLEPRGAVEHGVLGVHVQVHERVALGQHGPPDGSRGRVRSRGKAAGGARLV
jgi:hypothetical protein